MLKTWIRWTFTRGKQAKHHSFMLFGLGIGILPGWKQPPWPPREPGWLCHASKEEDPDVIHSIKWAASVVGDDMTTGSLGKPVDQTVFLYGSQAANWVFPKIGVPQNGWFRMEHPIFLWRFGGTYPLFSETSKNLKRLNWFVALRPCPILTCINFHAAKLMRSFSPRRALEGKNGVAADVLSKTGRQKKVKWSVWWCWKFRTVINMDIYYIFTYCIIFYNLCL